MRRLKIIVWKILTGRSLNKSERELKSKGMLEDWVVVNDSQVAALTPLGYRIAMDFAHTEGLTTRLKKVS